jgi:hypothetical protein
MKYPYYLDTSNIDSKSISINLKEFISRKLEVELTLVRKPQWKRPLGKSHCK